ncbi:hypothetical protein MA16_Dca013077 [Dendrobium catenatum]|uniref:Retrotransposon Copia-like N-terminal domain-containing protein n=1 Tax=Dendrobium catenatum TaxID=906689 RepID=A0A2I0X159_9ASPA|nr:hypothetical protein MA16_Dca013077 [Dendrobium catenatum]
MDELEDLPIPSGLKFIVSHLKTIVSIQLDADNYTVWKAQIVKILRANGFDRFLDSSLPSPSSVLLQTDGTSIPNRQYNQWRLTDQNLTAAICSTISSAILPYVVNLDSTAAIWSTLELGSNQ